MRGQGPEDLRAEVRRPPDQALLRAVVEISLGASTLCFRNLDRSAATALRRAEARFLHRPLVGPRNHKRSGGRVAQDNGC